MPTVTYRCKMFNFFNRTFTVSEQAPPSDVKDAFSLFADDADTMSADQLLRFLHDHQLELDYTAEDSNHLVDTFLQSRKQDAECDSNNNGLTLDEFFRFLFLVDFNDPLKSQVHHDMNAPLSHYFIYTGHNSYLTGNQLSSDCSDEPIKKSLQRGVRVIELDLWPNSTRDDIDVVHGRTLTAPVSLIQCLKSIKEYAFVKSEYPLILTLEDHLTPFLQAKVAEMIAQVFGDVLYYPQTDPLEEFPTPESLKGRILISTKPPKEYLESKQFKDTDSERPPKEYLESKEFKDSDSERPPKEYLESKEFKDSDSERPPKEYLESKEFKDSDSETPPKEYLESKQFKDSDSERSPKEYLESKQFKDSDSERESTEEGSLSQCIITELEVVDEKSNGSELDEEGLNTRDKKSDQQSAPEYKRLITIHAGKPKGHVKDHLNVVGGVKRLSLSEQELEKASATYGSDIVRFTQKNIIRVYPKGTRVTSSNFRPHIGWIYGAQMVAFNMQGHGKSLWYMQGMFRANGGCGYVKKPSFLIEQGHDEVFDPKKAMPVKKTLMVKVYMGNGWSLDFSKTHFDTFSPPDFYTKVCIVGVPADKANKKTKIIRDDWFPVWDEEFEFPLCVPELALLWIEVREHDKHEKDDFGGQACLPVSELRSGFRVVPLFDEKGEKFNSVRLLMRFQFK